MVLSVLAYLLPLLSLGLCSPTIPNHNVQLQLPARTVAQLNTTSWLENLAVRANGDLLVTQFAPSPVLYTVKNPSSPHAVLDPIYEFHETNVTILLGVTETYPDTFIIIAGNATANATGYPGTFSVWQASFSSPHTSSPSVHKIANVPAAKFLNGVVPLPHNPSILLLADSQFGHLFRFDTRIGVSEVIASGPQLDPHPERQNKTVGFGINGVRVRDGYVYFSSSNLVAIFRIAITREGYIAKQGKAPVELYADLSVATSFVDDFTFGVDGTLWAVSNYGNDVVAVSPGGGKVQSVVGRKDQLTLAGDTAAAFGRGRVDREVLYVSTAGGLAEPVNGTVTEPGKVVAVDTKGFWC